MLRFSARMALDRIFGTVSPETTEEIMMFPHKNETDRRAIVRIARQYGWTVVRDGKQSFRHTKLVSPGEEIYITVFDR